MAPRTLTPRTLTSRTLTTAQLNRALLARQGLLRRKRVPVARMIEQAGGLQTQAGDGS